MGKFVQFFKTVKNGISQGKDVYGFFSDFVKNRHQVIRRLNMIFLCISLAFAVLSGINFIFGGSLGKVHFAWSIAVYSLFGLYALTVIGIIIAESVYKRNVTIKATKTYIQVIRVFRRIVRAISLAMSVVAFAISLLVDDLSGKALAMNVIVQIFSVILFILSLSSGIAKLAKKFLIWLKSPLNQRQFRFVAAEWYQKINSDDKEAAKIKVVKTVNKNRLDGIQKAIDEYLIKAFGKKYIDEIEASDILKVTEKVPPEDKDDVEGTVKNIFAYAVECGIITDNPCDSLVFSGILKKAPPPSGAGSSVTSFFGHLFKTQQ